ncbi:hypothetical protein GP486_004951 [Trichoglossum hirsutum]|uniref:Uncharacterized protein n=1 Tax=Trichoglossum hirsutum TaxID=265104 RepID=A0A9P8RN60_9PEZI|nr:hypothetical protein GP486_004951 [Trichoglossum hirsutum]
MSAPPNGRPSNDGRAVRDVGVAIGGEDQQQGLLPPHFEFGNQMPSPRLNEKYVFERHDSREQLNQTGTDRSAADVPRPLSPVDSQLGRDAENQKVAGARDRSRTNGNGGSRSASGTTRVCKKCEEPLTGQFVRALGGTFHLECFKCRDCGQIVASKFFPVEDEEGNGQYPLCEVDYFRRLDLLCFKCGGALRGSYITALDRKYHIEHFTCSICPTVFGAQDSYYEHEGNVYCHYHYSTQFAQRCSGCQTAILKQFVELFRQGQNHHWHPECYMIHKFWNVRLAPSGFAGDDVSQHGGVDATDQERETIREKEERMEEKVYRIWSTLSSFEESAAACISDMLLHVSNGAYVDGVMIAKKFIWHVDILFTSADKLDALMMSEGIKGLSYPREAKLLCKKIVAFFSLLSKTQDTGVRKLGVTQELLSLVTGLAHYLKLLIRISLQGALKLEREKGNVEGLNQFMDGLGDLDAIKADDSLDFTAGVYGLADARSDICSLCKRPIEEECARLGERRWHLGCMACSNCVRELGRSIQDARWSENDERMMCQTCEGHFHDSIGGIEHVTRLQQYVFLLRVALARLLEMLRAGGTLPHTSGRYLRKVNVKAFATLTFLKPPDDPNLATYDSRGGHRLSTSPAPAMLGPDSRSKSYGVVGDEQAGPSNAYANTLDNIRRMRSTRMDKHISTTTKKARTSRIIDGPEGRSVRPGSAGADGSDSRNHGFQIVEDKDADGQGVAELTFGNQDALRLDDIPRIVAAEQAREQRPNAYKHGGKHLFEQSKTDKPRLINGHQRGVSGGQEGDAPISSEPPAQRGKKYFSELSALEYFIVRHVAVLSMEPLLEGHFNLEELLGLIESRKPTFWGKFGKAFKNDGKRGGKKKGAFGVALDALVERDGVECTFGVGPGALRTPALIDDTISAMRQMDMSVEGVFRKNGNIRRLKELADTIDTKGSESVDLTKEHPVQVAALLKKFLRELPDPMLTFKLHRLFITSQKIQDEEKRRRVLHLTCCLLPKSHRDSMEVLFTFLGWCSSFSHVDEESGSKMDIHNLATVITPNILYSNSKNVGMDDSFLAIEAVHSLIECNDTMCEVPEDLQSILGDTSLYNSSADITTKEILKRYGDIGRSPKRIVTTSNAPSPRSKEGRSSNPVATRVDTDPYQANAWQKESSVRHVQAPNNQNIPYNPKTQNNPPPHNFDFSNPNSPYAQRAGSSESQGSNADGGNRQSQYHHPGWGKQQPGQPGLGVTGAG